MTSNIKDVKYSNESSTTYYAPYLTCARVIYNYNIVAYNTVQNAKTKTDMVKN